MKRGLRIALIAIIAAGVMTLAYLAQFYWFKDGWPLTHDSKTGAVSNISPVSSVLISEVMSSNKTAYPGLQGLYPDWVELYNSGSAPVDITGWTLTDDAKSALKFSFPQRVMQPGEFLIVYLTDALVSQPDAPYQAPFKLSSDGDALLLYDATGSIMESLTIPALPGDASYARVGSTGDFIITELYTPGLVNTNDSYRQLSYVDSASEITLSITKVMPSNKTYLKDDNGLYSDWVEIHNPTSAFVSLKGCTLSDDMFDRAKWTFPDVGIEPGGYMTVFCTGVGTEKTASFKLSALGESVVLCDGFGKLIDSVTFGEAKPDQVLTRQQDGEMK